MISATILLFFYITISICMLIIGQESSSSVIPRAAAFIWPIFLPKLFTVLFIVSIILGIK